MTVSLGKLGNMVGLGISTPLNGFNVGNTGRKA